MENDIVGDTQVNENDRSALQSSARWQNGETVTILQEIIGAEDNESSRNHY
jgi:hypothetical protein